MTLPALTPLIIPCVDIQSGRAVRLYEGDPERETVYFDSPLEAARHWVSLGAGLVHLVDLDAATGRGDNRRIIEQIARELDVPVEVGGGIRDRQSAEALDAFEARAAADAEVQQCWRVSPGPDFVLVVHTRDMPGYLALSQRLFTADANVRNVKAFFSTKRAKFETKVPLALNP